jgi:hypothetical protein
VDHIPQEELPTVSAESRAVVEDAKSAGGFAILEVASHEDVLGWAARIAAACRCAQEVREIGFDPDSGNA